MKIRRASVSFIILFAGSLNCSERASVSPSVDNLKAEAIIYYTGSMQEVQQSLDRSLDIIKRGQFEEMSRSHLLYLTYCRLAVLHQTQGEKQLAGAAYEEASIYLKKTLGLQGESKDRQDAVLKQFTFDECIRTQTKWDERANKGVAPTYLKEKLKRPVVAD